MGLPFTDMLVQAWATPWRVWNELDRWLNWPWASLNATIAGVKLGSGWKCYGQPIWQIYRGSSVTFGDGAELRSSQSSNPLSPSHPVVVSTRSITAKIKVGHHFGMTGGSVVATQQITIGNRVIVGANSIICDTDFHPLDPDKRRREPLAGVSKPIMIEDDVFIGTQAIILKGSHIGRGSVIGAGSVVSGKIPAMVIAAGNPARVMKSL